MLGIEGIKKILPHREPFLMIDRVVENIPGDKTIAIKAVSANEWFFQGHFEKTKIMPGVLIVEAIAQTGGVAIMSMDEMKGKLAFLARINKARFMQKVVPGDVLELETTITAFKMNVGIGQGIAKVNGKVVAKAEITFAIGDEEN